MNEYTRREEVRWILISAVLLVACVAASLGLLLTARPSLVPDPVAAAEASAQRATAAALEKCPATIDALRKEANLLKDVAGASGIADEPTPLGSATPERAPKKPLAPPWPAVKTTHERARAAMACSQLMADQGTPDAASKAAWASVGKAAAVTAPSPVDGSDAQRAPSRAVYLALANADLASLEAQALAALEKAKQTANGAESRADDAKVEQALPKGLFGREISIAAGVLVSLIALLSSFFALRGTSVRRAKMLRPYRKSTKPPERGLHAAIILRLASEPMAGAHGMVIGAALGGLAAAGLGRLNADFYAGGVLLGAALGLATEQLMRRASQAASFRRRALSLAELEKPAIPIVLVLGSVQEGLEGEFIDFFLKLSGPEAASAVEKLANEAEEQILVAADKRALG